METICFFVVAGGMGALAAVVCWQWWSGVKLKEELLVARRKLDDQLSATASLREHGREGWVQSRQWCEKYEVVKIEVAKVGDELEKVVELFDKLMEEHRALLMNAKNSSDRWSAEVAGWRKWAVMEGGASFEGYHSDVMRKKLSAELQAGRVVAFGPDTVAVGAEANDLVRERRFARGLPCLLTGLTKAEWSKGGGQ